MSPLAVLSLAVFFALPIAWLVSEFRASRPIRIVVGLLAITSTTAGVAVLITVTTRFSYNAWYGGASKSLIETTITQIEEGNLDHVLKTLRRLDLDYYPTYENRAHYDTVVDEAVSAMKAQANLQEPTWEAAALNDQTWIGHWASDSGFWFVVDEDVSRLEVQCLGTNSPPLHNVSVSKSDHTLTFDEEGRWHHELTLLNKYEAKHAWYELETGETGGTETLHKLIRALPEERPVTEQAGDK